MAGEIYKPSAALALVLIPYRDGSQAMTDLVGVQIDMMIGNARHLGSPSTPEELTKHMASKLTL